MSIADQQDKIRVYLANAYDKCEKKKATIPEKRNLQNLASCIESITSGSGSSSYNVYSQIDEPVEKDGVWYRSSGASAGVKFYDYSTATGDFLEPEKFDFLKSSVGTIAQEIVDGYLYVISSTPANSFKMNLETKTTTSINTKYFGGCIGSCVYGNRIYMFYYSNYKFYYNYYDIATDTCTNQMGEYSISGSNSWYGNNLGCQRGGNIACCFAAYTSSGWNLECLQFNLDTEKFISFGYWSRAYTTANATVYGNYVYYVNDDNTPNYRLYRRDLTTGAQTTLITNTYPEDYLKGKRLYATADKIYMFTPSAASTSYYVFDLVSKTVETVKTNNSYYALGRTSVSNLLLDDKSGILYFRNPSATTMQAGMQFLPSPELDTLETGTLAIIQSPNNNSVKIQNSSNLHIGVDNVYKKTINGLQTGVILLGDGEKWIVLKNPNGETAIVTFDTDSESTIESQEVVLGQKLTSVETPTKSGYEFGDWYLEDEAFDFNTPIIKDITLVAHWLAYLTVTFNTDGGTLIESQQVLEGQKLTSVGTPTKSGYVFKCWQLNGEDFDINTPITEDITLTAVYEEVNFIAYIESSGTQYIDTGYCAYKTKTEITFQSTSKGTVNQFVMAGWNTDNNRYYPVAYQYSENRFATANKENTYTKLGDYDTVQHTIIYNDENNKVYFDGVEKATVSDLSTQTTNSIYLFALHNSSNAAQEYFIGRIMSVKITDKTSGTLVRDFNPALDNNGVACMYDMVTGKYFYNKGTGTFDIPDSLDNYTQLSYIESTGTQYIDTGYVPTKNMKWIMDVQFTAFESNMFNGAWQNNSAVQIRYLTTAGVQTRFAAPSSNNSYSFDATPSVRHTIVLDLLNLKTSVDGIEQSIKSLSDYSITHSMYLFANYSSNTSVEGYCHQKLYSCKLYDNNTLIRDFVPVKRNSDNVIGLFDIANNKFYTNKGTGTFIAGTGV